MPGGLHLALQQRCQISNIWLSLIFIELYVYLKYRQELRNRIIVKALLLYELYVVLIRG